MQEWMIYQIGDSEKQNQYRFIIVFDFQDAVVEEHLKPTEFIDTTSTLSGVLNGDVLVICDCDE